MEQKSAGALCQVVQAAAMGLADVEKGIPYSFATRLAGAPIDWNNWRKIGLIRSTWRCWELDAFVYHTEYWGLHGVCCLLYVSVAFCSGFLAFSLCRGYVNHIVLRTPTVACTAPLRCSERLDEKSGAFGCLHYCR